MSSGGEAGPEEPRDRLIERHSILLGATFDVVDQIVRQIDSSAHAESVRLHTAVRQNATGDAGRAGSARDRGSIRSGRTGEDAL